MKNLILFALLMVVPLSAEVAPAPAPLADGSLYVLGSTWIDQNGKSVVWSKSIGTPRVVALGYATCTAVCPRMISDMQRVEKALDASTKVRFTFITLDPENDKQPQLQALAKLHQLNPAHWDLLAGSNDDLMEIAVTLGVRFTRLPNGVDFAHSYLIVVIGPDGKILHKWADPAEGPAPSIKALQGL